MKAIRISSSGSSGLKGTFGESYRCSRRAAHALDLAQQLHAVEKAIAEAKRQLIHDHVDHCLDVAANGRGKPTRAVVSEFKAISRYL